MPPLFAARESGREPDSLLLQPVRAPERVQGTRPGLRPRKRVRTVLPAPTLLPEDFLGRPIVLRGYDREQRIARVAAVVDGETQLRTEQLLANPLSSSFTRDLSRTAVFLFANLLRLDDQQGRNGPVHTGLVPLGKPRGPSVSRQVWLLTSRLILLHSLGSAFDSSPRWRRISPSRPVVISSPPRSRRACSASAVRAVQHLVRRVTCVVDRVFYRFS